MDDNERLARIERRQEALVGSIGMLADMVGINNALLTQMMEWLKKPPSSELGDLIASLVAMVTEMQGEIRALPAVVARAVVDGELDGRG